MIYMKMLTKKNNILNKIMYKHYNRWNVGTSELKKKIEYSDDWRYKYVPAKTKIYNQGLSSFDFCL